MKRINIKKLGLGLGAAFLLLAIFLYGAYAYTLHRLQNEIDSFLEALVTEEDLKDFLQGKELVSLDDLFFDEPEEPDVKEEEPPPEDVENRVQTAAPVTSGRPPATPAAPPPDPGEPSPGGGDEGGEEAEEIKDHQPAEDPAQSETKPPGEEKEPVEEGEGNEKENEDEPSRGHAIFGSMPLKDQIYVISKISHFSLGELKEFVELYKAGGSGWCQLKERMLERLSEEDIQQLKALYLEYM